MSPPPSEYEIANRVARPSRPGRQCHIVCSNRRSHVGGTAKAAILLLLCSGSYLNGDCVAGNLIGQIQPKPGGEGGLSGGGGGRETKKEE